MSNPHSWGSGNAPHTASAGYVIAGQRYEAGSPEFAEAIADAHAAHSRPRCLCSRAGTDVGVEMYVARLGDGFIVKRMPNTGSMHAPDCLSYEPPADLTGLGEVLGSAICEDPSTGETRLGFDFPLLKVPGRSALPSAGSSNSRVVAEGNRLSLRGLLHYLWDQAELTRWQPGFAGKRSWGTVRRHLLAAAEGKFAGGRSLKGRLYVPEAFSVDRRDELNARRLAQWSSALASPGAPQPLMVMIAEVKEIVPARYGYKLVAKHVPDQAFALDGSLYRRLGRCFASALSLWSTSETVHLALIATFAVDVAGTPKLEEMSLMAMTRQWLPIEDAFERQLVDHLVHAQRHFFKGLRYTVTPPTATASAILIDIGEAPLPLYIAAQRDRPAPLDCEKSKAWMWDPAKGAIPALPRPRWG